MKRQVSGWGVAAAMSCLFILPAVSESAASAEPAAPAGSADAAKSALAARPTPKTAQGKPDLTGLWKGSMPFEFETEKTSNGSVTFGLKGGKPSPEVIASLMGKKDGPKYKPEYQAKLKGLQSGNLNRLDAAFSCGDPGLPRIGPPEQIVQTPSQVIFLYEQISGMVFRVIPLDGRPPRDTDPSYYGVGVGHWDGNTLVVETGNFSTDTWMGGEGYFHSEKMRVTERFQRVGDTLKYNVQVDDPEVLTAPWIKPELVLTKGDKALEEPFPCDAAAAASAADQGPRQLLH